MNEKLKLPIAIAFLVAAIAIVGFMGYRFMGPQQSIPTPKIVSVSELVRTEKTNPGALTDDQRRILAALTPEQKQKLLTQPNFSISMAQRALQGNPNNTASLKTGQ